MEQSRLAELEEKCIQEHAPTCVATCPVHVDVRAMCAEMGRGNFNAALKIYRKSIPFLNIISRICDQPCREVCRRKEIGEAVTITMLERACVDYAGPGDKVMTLPRRGKKVAVIGGGLSGMTVAYDLAKKGYGVVIFEMKNRLGGNLWDIPEYILPSDLIQKDITILESLGLELRLGFKVEKIEMGDSASPFDINGQLFDGIYVGINASMHEIYGLEMNEQRRIVVDPITYASSRDGIFAWGSNITNNPVWIGNPPISLPHSPILAISHGRRAATSIDRYLQRVSLTASRFKEGAYITRLYTNLEGIEPLPAVLPTDHAKGYTYDEAVEEAQRCIQCQCLECVKDCEYLKQYGSYPKRYVREIYNNLSIVKGERQKNQFINSCSLCGLCGEVCPENLDMGKVCLEARRTMVAQNRMPPSAHEYALRDMIFSNNEKYALAHHQPGTDKSRYLFFPGCQLGSSFPEYVEKIYAYLIEKSSKELGGNVGLMLRCCGAPAD
jgi:glutamate synthase (NADPH/NADH) small chain